MPLLERYLDAVGRHLPPEKETDILAELRDDIQARLDDRAAALGRSLTEADEAEVLRLYGRPILMASRYGRQRQLVGADWFPFYWTTLKIVLAVAFIAQVATVVVLAIAARPTGAAAQRLFAFPFQTALPLFAWVTLVFAVLERTGLRSRFKENWNPRALPRVAPRRTRPSRLGVAIELVISALFVTWWTAVHRSTDLLQIPPAIQLAPAWSTFYWPLLLLVLASMAVKCVVLVRPDWNVFRLAAGLLLTAGGITVAAFVLQAGPLVLPGQPGLETQRLSESLNQALRWSIAVAIVIALVTTAVDAWRWNRDLRRSRP